MEKSMERKRKEIWKIKNTQKYVKMFYVIQQDIYAPNNIPVKISFSYFIRFRLF